MSDANSSRSESLGPHLALFAVQILFGTWPIFGKIALRALPVTGIVAFRVAGAAVAFLILRSVAGSARIERKSDYARFFLYALLGVVLNQLLFVKGLALSTVINATLLGTAIPVFAMAVSVVIGLESFSSRKALGTLVASAGVIFLINPFRADFSGDKSIGNLLLLANTLAYAVYLVISQQMFKRYGALNVITWVFVFGSVLTVPIGAKTLAETPLNEVSWAVWLVVLYIILLPTVGAYYLNAWALSRVAPSTVAAYIYLQPLIAFAIAPLILGDEESWNARILLAAALIFAGVALVTLRGSSRTVAELSEHPDALGH